MRAALAVVVVSVLSFVPASASAWTEASVRSVHAEVRVDREARAHVILTATVRVHGGWLEGLEIAGLDPDLVLDETYDTWAEGGDGETYTPSVSSAHGDRVHVAFRGRSPRRGDVRIGFAYHTSLAHRATEPVEDEDRVRVSWTLPGWRAGLDGVQIDLVLPPGSVVGPRDAEQGAELSLEVEELADRTVFHFWRAHLPRTMAWTVRGDVPAEAMDPGLRGAPVVRLPPPPPSAALAAARDPSSFWMLLPSVLALLALAQIGFVGRRARRSGVAARSPLFAPALVRGALVLAAAPAAASLGLAGHALPALGVLGALALCAAHLRGGAPGPTKLGAFRPVDARWLRAARKERWRSWLYPEALLDVTTLPGALHAGAWLALPWLLPDPPVPLDVLLLAAVLPAPIFATGTRLSFPRSVPEVLRALLAFARRIDTLPDGVALRPVMLVAADGEVQDVRVRTVLDHRPDGLLRLDLALGHQAHAGGWHVVPEWLIVTRADSPADVALRALGLDDAVSKGGRRVVRQIDAADRAVLARVIDALRDCPAAVEVARGVAAPAETVRDVPAPQAVGF